MSSFDDNCSISSLFSSWLVPSALCSSNEDGRLAAGSDTSEDELDEDVTQMDSPTKKKKPYPTAKDPKVETPKVDKKFPVINPDLWSPAPAPLAHCPPGLEKLYLMDTVFVRRLPPSKHNLKKYIVVNGKGEQVYIFKEEPNEKRKVNATNIRVYDQRMEGIWTFKRSRGSSGDSTRIFAPLKKHVIKVAPSERGLLISQKKNPILSIEFVKTGSYAIKSLDGKSVGKMKKLSENDRMASWPMDLLVEAKAACLVSLLLLETVGTNTASGPSSASGPPKSVGSKTAVGNTTGPASAVGPVVAQPVPGAPGTPQLPVSDKWAVVPASAPDCPSGLEALTVLDHAFLAWVPEGSRYSILNQSGEKIYFLQEMIPGNGRGGFKRELDIRAFDSNNQEMWGIARKPPGCCGDSRIEVYDQGQQAILSMTNSTQMDICLGKSKSPVLKIHFIRPSFAYIKSLDGQNIGEIAAAGNQDSFIASWPMELPAVSKLGCMTALVLMDIFFDTKHVQNAPASDSQ